MPGSRSFPWSNTRGVDAGVLPPLGSHPGGAAGRGLHGPAHVLVFRGQPASRGLAVAQELSRSSKAGRPPYLRREPYVVPEESAKLTPAPPAAGSERPGGSGLVAQRTDSLQTDSVQGHRSPSPATWGPELSPRFPASTQLPGGGAHPVSPLAGLMWETMRRASLNKCIYLRMARKFKFKKSC